MEKTAASLKVGDQVHCLSEQVATLGRASDNTIVLNDDSVSSHHAEIFMRDGVYFVRDLGSTNNTTLRGVSVSESELNSDDILSFGTVEAVFQSVSQIQESSNSEDQDSADQPNDSQEPNHLSFGGKIKQFGKDAWAETKRSSHLVSLKAQIEKLTRIDLRQAFHDLGKTCYESKIGEEKFSTHFMAICSLQERIAEGRKGVHAAEGAKTMEKLKAAAQDQAGKISSEALSVKLGSLFVELGKAGESQARDLMPKEHLEAIDRIEQNISDLCSKSSALNSARPLNTKTRKLNPVFVLGLGTLFVASWILWANLNANDSAPKADRNESPILGVQYSQIKSLYPDLSALYLIAGGEGSEKRAVCEQGKEWLQLHTNNEEIVSLRYYFWRIKPTAETLHALMIRHGFSELQTKAEIKPQDRRIGPGSLHNLKMRWIRPDQQAYLELWSGGADDDSYCVWVRTIGYDLENGRRARWRSNGIIDQEFARRLLESQHPDNSPFNMDIGDLNKLYPGLNEDLRFKYNSSDESRWRAYYVDDIDGTSKQFICLNGVLHFVSISSLGEVTSGSIDKYLSTFASNYKWNKLNENLNYTHRIRYISDDKYLGCYVVLGVNDGWSKFELFSFLYSERFKNNLGDAKE